MIPNETLLLLIRINYKQYKQRNKLIRKIYYTSIYPFLFLIAIWLVRLYCYHFNVDMTSFGIHPRNLFGLLGIFIGPFVHSDYSHLLANCFPLFMFGLILCHFYRPIALRIFLWIYIITGFWVWVAARNAYHIGASGIVYGLACFLFFSGIFRRDTRLLAISMLVTFAYGSLVWGVLPITESVSWESHLFGSIAGCIVAFYFKAEGPTPQKYDLDDEEEIINLSPEA